MARKRTIAKIDRELIAQLDEAEARHESVQAVVSLKRARAGQAVPSSDEVGRTVKSIVQRVEQETGAKPTDLNVFGSLCSFVIEAEPGFIRKLIEHEEVGGAVANQSGRARRPAVVKKRSSGV